MSSSIELNGKRYDARTGRVINSPEKSSQFQQPIRRLDNGAVLDGFTRRAATLSAINGLKTAEQAKTHPRHAGRQLEKAQTLMRPAVKKPVVKNDIQAVRRIEKPAHQNLARQARAQTAPKSPHVSKFGPSKLGQIIKKELHLPVAKPAVLAEESIESKASQELHRIEQAIAGATSHLQELEDGVIKKVRFLDRVGFRNRLANLATISLSALLLAGFFAYQNIPALEMRLAATRSGVTADMPSYKPSGYGIAGRVNSSPGKVIVSFKSRTDDKKFSITQQTSNWNSTSLLANHVAKTSQPYQTYQNDGKTVYIFDNSNATWVNGGVWYQVEGDAQLTSDQLLRLANSF